MSKFVNEVVEMKVLAALMFDIRILENCNEIQADYFYVSYHKDIYQGILNGIKKNIKADPFTLRHLMDITLYEKLQENNYLDTIYNYATETPYINENIQLLEELHFKRKLIESNEKITENLDKPVEELVDITLNECYEYINKKPNDKLIKLSDGSQAAFERALVLKRNESALLGLSTGFKKLDRLTNGLQKSNFIILAGRPSMGKTTLALSIAMNAARDLKAKGDDGSVIFVSLEMSEEQVSPKLLSANSGVELRKIQTGKMKEEECNRVIGAIKSFKEINLYIYSKSSTTIESLKSTARKLHRQHNMKLLVVDYLQLIRTNKFRDQRVWQVSEISIGLKEIAKELDIPVIALSQLSREVEKRVDKRPMLSDLRDSGTIEQDADIVMFVYREEYYLSRRTCSNMSNKVIVNSRQAIQTHYKLDEVKDIAEITVAKNRNGETGNLKVQFCAEFSAFNDTIQESVAA